MRLMIFFALLSLALAAPAQAHVFWVKPERFAIPAGSDAVAKPLPFVFSGSHHYFAQEFNPASKGDTYTATVMTPGGKSVPACCTRSDALRLTGGAANEAWRTPLGQKLEVMALSDPSQLKVGEEFRIRQLYDGKPLAQAKVNAVYAGFEHGWFRKWAISEKTDRDGIAAFALDRPGLWLLDAAHELPPTNPAKADLLRYKASLMLDVQPAGRP